MMNAVDAKFTERFEEGSDEAEKPDRKSVGKMHFKMGKRYVVPLAAFYTYGY